MKCHILFFGKNKKNISKCRLLKIVPRVLTVKLSEYVAGLGGSVGCAVRLETRRSPVQLPLRSATFFHGDRS